MTRKIVAVAGTRPEAIKMAPIVARMRPDEDLDVRLLVTGQHREILDQVLQAFDLVPDADLEIMRPGQDLASLTALALNSMAPVLEQEAPDAVVVQGDTTTTFAAALAAFYARIPVVHVEAGLRTGDLDRPFPEEANRRLATTLARLHLAPTPWARSNLLAERVAARDIVVTGNTVVDALHAFMRRPFRPVTEGLGRALGEQKRLVVVTTHRRENWGVPQRHIARAVRRAARAFPDCVFLVPMHPNPIVRTVLTGFLSGLDNVVLTEPLAYDEMVQALSRAWVVLTDSGGIQEEGCALGAPVLVLRDVTERPEGVDAGVMRLVGTDERRVFEALAQLLRGHEVRRAMAREASVYGDGRAAERSHLAIRRLVGLPAGSDLQEFVPEVASRQEGKGERAWPVS